MLYISCLGHIHLIAESMYPFATLFLLPQQPPPPQPLAHFYSLFT